MMHGFTVKEPSCACFSGILAIPPSFVTDTIYCESNEADEDQYNSTSTDRWFFICLCTCNQEKVRHVVRN